MEKSRLVWGLGLMGVLSLMSLQGCSDDATTGDNSSGGTTGGTAGSGGTTGGTAGTGGTTGGTAGTAGTGGGGAGGTGGGGTGGGGAGGTAGTGGGGAGGAGGSGGGANAAKCTSYCEAFEDKCPTLYGTDYAGDTCESTCAGWDLGTEDATSGDNIECRIWHLGNITSGTNNVPHCGHASKDATAGGCQ